MSNEIKALVKNTWSDYFNGAQNEIIKQIDTKIVNQYVDAMSRLETDFDFQRELGIGL